MSMLIRITVWLLAAMGLINIIQTGIIYFRYEQPKDIVFMRNDSLPVIPKDVVCDEKEHPGRKLVDMAILSALVYVDKNDPIREELSAGWEKVEFTEKDRHDFFPGEPVSGLKFDLWANRSKKVSVISFRGTDGLFSWHANFHWLLKLLPAKTQYQKVQESIHGLVSLLQAKTQKDFEIFTTGHSLGGGLAQHALYNHAAIKLAVVFNSSPVTAWNDIDEKHRGESVIGNQVVRVHENGEVLEFFRLLMKIGYAVNPRPNEKPYFVEYRFNFEPFGGKTRQHGITGLAEKLFGGRIRQHGMIGLAEKLLEQVKRHCPE